MTTIKQVSGLKKVYSIGYGWLQTVYDGDCLHDIYSRAQDRMSYKGDHTPFNKQETLECIILFTLRITFIV